MTRDEAFQQYEGVLARIGKQSQEATDAARATLREHLKVLREAAHTELKAIRTIEQKTKRSK